MQISAPEDGPATAYTLNVSVVGTPERLTDGERIRFQTGTISAQMRGSIAGQSQNRYLLRAQAGQTLSLSLSDGALTVVSPSGTPLIRGGVTAEPVQDFEIALPETGDYTLTVTVPTDSRRIPYTLDISVIP